MGGGSRDGRLTTFNDRLHEVRSSATPARARRAHVLRPRGTLSLREAAWCEDQSIAPSKAARMCLRRDCKQARPAKQPTPECQPCPGRAAASHRPAQQPATHAAHGPSQPCIWSRAHRAGRGHRCRLPFEPAVRLIRPERAAQAVATGDAVTVGQAWQQVASGDVAPDVESLNTLLKCDRPPACIHGPTFGWRAPPAAMPLVGGHGFGGAARRGACVRLAYRPCATRRTAGARAASGDSVVGRLARAATPRCRPAAAARLRHALSGALTARLQEEARSRAGASVRAARARAAQVLLPRERRCGGGRGGRQGGRARRAAAQRIHLPPADRPLGARGAAGRRRARRRVALGQGIG